jgi:hypothetical protein
MKRCLIIRSIHDPKHSVVAVITDVGIDGDGYIQDSPRGTKYDMIIRNWCRNTGRMMDDAYLHYYAECAEIISWTDLPQFA